MIAEAQPRGRPLRFLLILLLFWSGGRLALTIDVDAMGLRDKRDAMIAAPLLPRSAPISRSSPQTPARISIAAWDAVHTLAPAGRIHSAHAMPRPVLHDIPGTPGIEKHPFTPFPATAAYESQTASSLASFPPGQGFDMPAPRPTAADDGKWLFSGWALWRPGSDPAAASGPGRLGASQAGMRVDRRLDIGLPRPVRLTAYARVSSAMVRPAAPEAALGIALQPDRRPSLTVGIERRIALGKGGRDAMAAVAASGIGPVALPASLRLDGYAQAGMVGVHARDAFVDGRASLLHPLGGTRMAAGLGLSGGAQPGLSRLDIGPELRVDLPIGTGFARVDAGWRQRIAGDARPGSGPVVTIGTSF